MSPPCWQKLKISLKSINLTLLFIIFYKGKISLEGTLNKDVFFHGEEIFVTVNIHNNSTKPVRYIHVSLSTLLADQVS